MKRTANWCWLVLVAALAFPTFASAQDEGTAYSNFYAEQDCAKKAPMGEQFVTTYKSSQYVEGTVMLTADCYYKLKNFAKVSEIAKNLDQLAPNMKPGDKARVNLYALDLAQQNNNAAQTIAFGEKVIAIVPNDPNTLLILSSTIAASMPNDKAATDKAIAYAEQGLKALGGMDAKSAGVSETDWAKQKMAFEGNLHSTLGGLYFNSRDYDKAADELVAATKDLPKDGPTWYLLGCTYEQQYSIQMKPYLDAVDKSNAAIKAKADQAVIEEGKATAAAFEESLHEKQDQAIDALATAVALGGTPQTDAMNRLKKLYTAKHNNSTDGLDQLINSKKPAQ